MAPQLLPTTITLKYKINFTFSNGNLPILLSFSFKIPLQTKHPNLKISKSSFAQYHSTENTPTFIAQNPSSPSPMELSQSSCHFHLKTPSNPLSPKKTILDGDNPKSQNHNSNMQIPPSSSHIPPIHLKTLSTQNHPPKPSVASSIPQYINTLFMGRA
eukprot:TRINITY_DN1616_c1_g1_i1.p1 TRINITY_DN1616_c1_g1~~TRINITY_DN1616_c1_g1_i1.p1  ORF type:complete len:158 (+),score=32.20 TRINITY_DN1616_c1_g1_i1:533-1006(+)